MSIVQPKSPEVARALLALAEEQGLDPAVVRSTEDGFDVPESIGDAYSASLATEKPKAPAAKKATARKTEKE